MDILVNDKTIKIICRLKVDISASRDKTTIPSEQNMLMPKSSGMWQRLIRYMTINIS
jgi:hypothetical protein